MSFAEVTDVETRLGRELTTAEEGSVELLLDTATAVIAVAAGKSEAWAAALDPVPAILKGFCIELACRGLANPEGLFSKSETLGSYSYSPGFNRDTPGGLTLTPIERRVIRNAVGNIAYEVRTPTATEDYLEDLVS